MAEVDYVVTTVTETIVTKTIELDEGQMEDLLTEWARSKLEAEEDVKITVTFTVNSHGQYLEHVKIEAEHVTRIET